jgi:hypothetical protein
MGLKLVRLVREQAQKVPPKLVSYHGVAGFRLHGSKSYGQEGILLITATLQPQPQSLSARAAFDQGCGGWSKLLLCELKRSLKTLVSRAIASLIHAAA